MRIGRHWTGENPLKALSQARETGSGSLAFFLKDPKKQFATKPKPDFIKEFKAKMLESGYTPDDIIAHSGFMTNPCNPNLEKRIQMSKALISEIKYCLALGLNSLVLHPGSHLGKMTSYDACLTVAQELNAILPQVPSIRIYLENMAGGGGIIGSNFGELRMMLMNILPYYRNLVGICLDTAHLWGAGTDISNVTSLLGEFDRVVGLRYLKAIHLNDSKSARGSRIDKHETIGKGTIGTEILRNFIRDPRLKDIPIILETPDETVFKDEVQLLLGEV